MPAALSIVPTLIVVAVLITSGVAKIRVPDTAAGWKGLGLPARLVREGLIRSHPYAELLLAATMLFTGEGLGTAAAAVSALLFAAYLTVVWRSRIRTPAASCACFGSRAPITNRTVLRNIWLLLVAIAAATTINSAPLWGGVARTGADEWPWLIATTVAVLTASLIKQPPTPGADPDTRKQHDTGGTEDYVRVRTPAVPIQLGDGQTIHLRELTLNQPLLALAVSETCDHCRAVIESIDEYRALLPEVSVRLLLQSPPDTSPLTSKDEPQTLHDPHRYVSGSIADWLTPTAVLFGADGMLAGGPVTGAGQIGDFLGDIYESLHGRRPSAPQLDAASSGDHQPTPPRPQRHPSLPQMAHHAPLPLSHEERFRAGH